MSDTAFPKAKLRIEFLGAGRVVSEDEENVLPPGIPLTVLAYLYVAPASVHRDRLVELFWPGKDRGRALQSLRQTLSRIRRVVGDHRVLTDGRLVGIDRGLFASDLESFKQAVEAGHAQAAMDLWKGGFLQEARHPECWEVEDWLESERSRLQDMLITSVFEFGEQACASPEAARDGLGVLDAACQQFPLHEGLWVLRFNLSLRAGYMARAAGLLEEARVEEDVSLPLEEMERALAEAMETHEPEPPSSYVPEEKPDRAVFGRRRPMASALVLVFGVLLAWIMLQLDPPAGPQGPDDSLLSDYVVLFCSTFGTFGVGEPAIHLFRMDLDGRNKQRVSDKMGCSHLWLEEAGVIVMITDSSSGGGFLRLTPQPNPLTEWTAEPLRSTAGFLAPPRAADRQSPLVAMDGRYAILALGIEEGRQAIFVLDPVADSLHQITPALPLVEDPVWDEARGQVVFSGITEDGGEPGLWAVDIKDPQAQWTRLTPSQSLHRQLVLRGDHLLAVRDRGAETPGVGRTIHLLNLATGDEQVLISRPWNNVAPQWAPDGRHFCWVSEELGPLDSDIWVMDLTSRDIRNLTAEMAGRNYGCQWGPDSRTLFFSSKTTGRTQVYRVPREGGVPENITRMDSETETGGVIPRSAYTRFIP